MTSTLEAPSLQNIRRGMSVQQIISIMMQRRSQDSYLIRQMIEARDRYNGDVVIPLPDVDGKPQMDPPTPNMVAGAVDGTAMRAASSKPAIMAPWLQATDDAMAHADTRRKMLYAASYHNQMSLKMRRSYRHLAGYGTTSWLVMPDDECGRAKIELRDPLTSYPELRAPDDVRQARNVGFVFGRSMDWITSHYPDSREFFGTAGQQTWDTLWDVFEWIDEDDIVLGVLGPRMPAYSVQEGRPNGFNGFELKRWINKAGCVPAVVPRRVTMDRIQGQMATLFGSIDLFSRLTALELVAAEKHIFPDMVMLGENQQTPRVVSGQWRDGRTGEVNEVVGARDVKYLSTQTAPFVAEMVSGLEDSIRETGGGSSMMGGSNPGGLRTGRALGVMGDFSIDPRVEELQNIMELTASAVYSSVIEVEKGYFPNKKTVAFTGLAGDEQVVEYTPSKDLDSSLNVVSYAMPGADNSQLTVAIAQLVGAGLMAKHTGRVKHPFIDDAHAEEQLIVEEQLLAALLGGISNQAAQGQMPAIDVARVLQLLRQKKPLQDAVVIAQKESQERQAAQAPPPQEGQGASPAQMPGLGAPGMGAESQPPAPGADAMPPPAASLDNLHGMIRDLNSTPNVQPTGGPPVGS